MRTWARDAPKSTLGMGARLAMRLIAIAVVADSVFNFAFGVGYFLRIGVALAFIYLSAA